MADLFLFDILWAIGERRSLPGASLSREGSFPTCVLCPQSPHGPTAAVCQTWSPECRKSADALPSSTLTVPVLPPSFRPSVRHMLLVAIQVVGRAGACGSYLLSQHAAKRGVFVDPLSARRRSSLAGRNLCACVRARNAAHTTRPSVGGELPPEVGTPWPVLNAPHTYRSRRTAGIAIACEAAAILNSRW